MEKLLAVVFAVGILIIFVHAEEWCEQTDFLPTEEDWPECDLSFLHGKYSMMHPEYCDRFYACDGSVPYLMQCEDGFGYLPFRGCKLLHLVDCSGRKKLQRPRGNAQCPRLYGIFSNPRGCGHFNKCLNGTAIEDKCALSLMFDNDAKVCRDPTMEEAEACKPAPVIRPEGQTTTSSSMVEQQQQKFQCPADDLLAFGDHSRHPYPGNCHFFIMCLRDGSIKVGGCEPGKGYNPITSVCEPLQNLQGCH